MIKHIVLFKLLNKSQIINFVEMLKHLKLVIPAIQDWEVGIQGDKELSGRWDVSLVSTFQNKESFYEYFNNPDHQKVFTYMKENNIEYAVVDYPLN